MSTLAINPGTRRWSSTARASSRSASRCRLPPTARRRRPPRVPELAQAAAGFVRLGHDDWSVPWSTGRSQRSASGSTPPGGRPARLGVARRRPEPAASAPSPKQRCSTRSSTGSRNTPRSRSGRASTSPATRSAATPGSARPACSAPCADRGVDGKHPLVIIQAPRGAVADLVPYRPAFDITGADIYPISYPPGLHAGTAEQGHQRRRGHHAKIAARRGQQGALDDAPDRLERRRPLTASTRQRAALPSLFQERFMAYQAIVNGARGIVFFGGHLIEIARPSTPGGWNWTFWETCCGRSARARPRGRAGLRCSRPTAARSRSRPARRTSSSITRGTGNYLYLIAVRRGGSDARVAFTGVPRKANGSPLTIGRGALRVRAGPLPPPPLPSRGRVPHGRRGRGEFRDWSRRTTCTSTASTLAPVR